MKEIPLSDIFSGKNWKAIYQSEADVPNPEVVEATDFIPGDMGLFSGVCKLADGSELPALALKDFNAGGQHLQTFCYTKLGWLDIQVDGFFRAADKYAHDIFPFEVFLASPAQTDTEIGTKAEQNRKTFQDALPRLKELKFEYRTTRRRLM